MERAKKQLPGTVKKEPEAIPEAHQPLDMKLFERGDGQDNFRGKQEKGEKEQIREDLLNLGPDNFRGKPEA